MCLETRKEDFEVAQNLFSVNFSTCQHPKGCFRPQKLFLHHLLMTTTICMFFVEGLTRGRLGLIKFNEEIISNV